MQMLFVALVGSRARERCDICALKFYLNAAHGAFIVTQRINAECVIRN